MIIGVVGTNGAGKDTVAQLLAEKLGWPAFSMSDELREIARARGLDTNRPTLQRLGNELREKHGGDYISGLILAKRSDDFIIGSIRNPQEIEPLRKVGDFVLLMVDADARVRHQRAGKRLRSAEDRFSFEQFVAIENKELDGGVNQLRLQPVWQMADIKIDNSGTIEELGEKLDSIVLRLRSGSINELIER